MAGIRSTAAARTAARTTRVEAPQDDGLMLPDGTPIPDKYRKFGATRAWNPTDPQRLRLWLTGYPGTGKTSFAYSNPRAVVLDLEDSGRDVPFCKAVRIPILTTDLLVEVLRELIADGEAGKRWCDHVVIDTVDGFCDLLEPAITADYNTSHTRQVETIFEAGQEGAGFAKFSTAVMSWITDLYTAGYGWTCIGHVRERGGKNPGEQPYSSPAIIPSLAGRLYREAQLMVNLYRTSTTERVETGRMVPKKFGKNKGDPVPEVQTRQVQACFAELGVTPSREGALIKARYLQFLPGEPLPLPYGGGWSTFCDAWTSAVAAARTWQDQQPQPQDHQQPKTVESS